MSAIHVVSATDLNFFYLMDTYLLRKFIELVILDLWQWI